MPRPTSHKQTGPARRSTPAYGIPSNQGGGSVGLDTHNMIGIAAGYRGDRRAEGLANVLGIVNSVVQPELLRRAEQAGKEAAAEGFLDETTGRLADPKRMSKDVAYRYGVTKAKTEADMIAARGEWAQLVEQEGYNNLAPDEYEAKLEEWSAKRFDHLADDRVATELALPQLAKLRQEALLSHRDAMVKETNLKYEQNSGVALTQFVEDSKAAIAANPESAPAIRAGMKARIAQEHDQHYRVLGAAANAKIASQMIEMAVASGDESLLELIPERASSVPAIGRAIEHGRRDAIATRNSRSAEETRQRDEARNEARRESRNSIANEMVNGSAGKGLAVARQLLDAGVLDFEDYRALENFHESLTNDTGDGDGEGSVAALNMEVRLRSGEASMDDLLKSDLTVKEKRRLLPLTGKKDDARARNYRSDLRLRATPPKSLGGEVRPGDIQMQADILAEYDEAIDGGASAQEAYNAIRQKPEYRHLFQQQQAPAVPFNPNRSPDARSAPASRRNSLQPGDVVDGYRFKGGDRYDRKNWEAI